MKREVFVLALEGAADANAFVHVPHATVRLGAAGEAMAHFRNAGVKEVVLAGGVKRPSILSLKPDAAGARLLAHIGAAFFSGDDALLKAIVVFFEQEGFRIVGANEIVANLTVPVGVLGKYQPQTQDEADIAEGLKAAQFLGKKDIGQAAIVQHGKVLGVEDAEGTDVLITRCAKVKQPGKSGVLVKVKKPGQETRVDLPSIGPETVEKIYAAGFAGIAIEANAALVLDKEKTIARADELGVFLVAV